MKEKYQKQLNELIEKIKKDGFVINSNYEIIDPNEKIYVIEEYWRSDGAYESEGRRKESNYAYEIKKQDYDNLYEYFSKLDLKSDENTEYFSKLFECELDIELGDYEVTDIEEGSTYFSYLNKIDITNDKITLDFGEDYRESFGGYIEIKKANRKYLNDFERIDINTFE